MLEKINSIHGLALNYNGIGKDDEPPLYFLKSKSCLTFEGGIVPYPTFQTEEVWTEVELGIVVGKNDSVKGFVVTADVTCKNTCGRDHHLPMSKARTGFCPVGSFRGVEDVDFSKPLVMTTSINGVEKQRGTTEDMKYNVKECIDYVSKIVKLEENDIILTGTPITPLGGPQYDCIVQPGDVINHKIENIGEINYEFK